MGYKVKPYLLFNLKFDLGQTLARFQSIRFVFK